MKAKYLIIYIVVGVAFLGASLWVLLSKGKSAKAIRYKYKLGGIMLTAWSMLTFASCEGPEPYVTCYDRGPSEYAYVEETESVKNGDVLVVYVVSDSSGKFRCRITSKPNSGDPVTIQEQVFQCGAGKTPCKMTIAAGDYKGKALVTVYYLMYAEDGSEIEVNLGNYDIITII